MSPLGSLAPRAARVVAPLSHRRNSEGGCENLYRLWRYLEKKLSRDFDGELKALQDKARDLKSRKVQQLGELVIATGADSFSVDELAGALIVLTETKDAGKREAWARRGAAFFQSRARRTAPAAERHTGGAKTQPGGAQPSTGSKGAA